MRLVRFSRLVRSSLDSTFSLLRWPTASSPQVLLDDPADRVDQAVIRLPSLDRVAPTGSRWHIAAKAAKIGGNDAADMLQIIWDDAPFDLHQTDEHGNSVLHHALEPLWMPGLDAPAVAWLLAHGADPRSINHQGVSVMDRAQAWRATYPATVAALEQGVLHQSMEQPSRAAEPGLPPPVARARPRL